MSDVEFVLMEPKHKASTPEPSLHEAWKRHVSQLLPSRDQKRFHVVEARLDTLKPPHSEFDCIVSPANSYGIMDGGSVLSTYTTMHHRAQVGTMR